MKTIPIVFILIVCVCYLHATKLVRKYDPRLFENAKQHHTTTPYGQRIIDPNNQSGWKLNVKIFKKSAFVDLFIPVSAPIGFYELFYSKYWHSELLEKNLLILFNPWKRDDGVYMENSNFLNDYILNEEGRILSGTYLKKSFIPWHYSQVMNRVSCTNLN
ncbi:hypothetical protein B4U79_18729 [Dinothrombium tinctorium]|uniref:Uncharacterized protein n=1 Tax=Dinothrombium tinctorium TaxID=1965070 RepID=A0A443QA75_9ACAR|nr:hypothetical protein B4U79_18729 [Dinothrombium tinctorium]